MTVEEMKKFLEEKKSEGYSEEELLKIFYAMYVKDDIELSDLRTLTEMLGIRPPNADVNVCIALAICTFILIHFYGFRHKKAKYLGKYKILIPLLTDIAVPVSMTFRMFGSILSGFLMMALINNVLAPLTPVLPAFASLLFTCFHALIQSYVFAVLSLSFVAEAIE